MLVTKNKEQFTDLQGRVFNELLFVEVTKIMIDNESKNITAYVRRGYLKDVIEQNEVWNDVTKQVEIVETTTQQKEVLVTKPGSYSEVEIKQLLDFNNIVLNSNDSNLIASEIATASAVLLQYVVSTEPHNYFGLSIDKWENA